MLNWDFFRSQWTETLKKVHFGRPIHCLNFYHVYVLVVEKISSEYLWGSSGYPVSHFYICGNFQIKPIIFQPNILVEFFEGRNWGHFDPYMGDNHPSPPLNLKYDRIPNNWNATWCSCKDDRHHQKQLLFGLNTLGQHSMLKMGEICKEKKFDYEYNIALHDNIKRLFLKIFFQN